MGEENWLLGERKHQDFSRIRKAHCKRAAFHGTRPWVGSWSGPGKVIPGFAASSLSSLSDGSTAEDAKDSWKLQVGCLAWRQSACLPMVRRTYLLTILGRGRRDLCFPHPYSIGLEEKGMQWTHNWQHSSCLQGWQEMWMAKSGSMWSGF